MIPRPQRAAQYYPQIMVCFQRIVTLLSGGGQKGGGATLSAPPQAQAPHFVFKTSYPTSSALPPPAQAPHSCTGERKEPERKRSKTDSIGAQTETALATIAAPNPMPHASPRIKTRPQEHMLLGP